MAVACMFPGQGSQFPGMGGSLFDRYPDVVQEADSILGYSVRDLCLNDPQGQLNQTKYTQPALYIVGVLSYLEWSARAVAPAEYLAGHSLGEYCALFAAGVFSFADGLRLVAKRGELMANAPAGAMAAVLQLDETRLREILDGFRTEQIDIANLNARKQLVLSGVRETVQSEALSSAIEDAGGIYVPLNVSAAFHSRCMLSASEAFGRYLNGFSFSDPQVPVVSNLEARPYPAGSIAEILRLQVKSPVRWHESICWMRSQGCADFVELGAGDVLTRLYAKIASEPIATPTTDVRAVANENAAGTGTGTGTGRRVIFMYAGQGSQYHEMGAALFRTNPAFRTALEECDAEVRALSGISIVEAMYQRAGKATPFLDIRSTHPAIFAFGYALTRALEAAGIRPDAVLGYSLGEYVAAVTAGVIERRAALELVVQQAALLHAEQRPGGLLAVLGPRHLVDERADLFAGLQFAGENSPSNFLMSGELLRIENAQRGLTKAGWPAVIMPVEVAFHSDLIDNVEQRFKQSTANTHPAVPNIPVYSAFRAGVVDFEAEDDILSFLWGAVRKEVRFHSLMRLFGAAEGSSVLLDLSATASFFSVLKHDFPEQFRCLPLVNPFGSSVTSFETIRDLLGADDRQPEPPKSDLA